MQSVIETAEAIRRGEITAREAVARAFAAVEARNPALNAFIILDRDGAERSAAEIDARIARGEAVGPLAGVPFGVKDMDDAIGMETTKGSLFLKGGKVKTEDSPQVARLRAAGAVPIGKTATCEFGMYGSTDTLAWGTTRNPWDTTKTPGGSSGGASAAVAAGMVPFATGSDAGGSIRGPAAYTGLVGLKPSHGRVPRGNGFGNFAVQGNLTRTVGDTARLLDVVAGPDDRDRQSLPPVRFSYEQIIETLPVAGLKAVWSEDLGYAVTDPEVAAIAREAAARLMQVAALSEVKTAVSLPNILRPWVIVMLSGLRDDLTRDGILPGGLERLAPSTRYMLERADSVRGTMPMNEAWAVIHALEREMAAFFSGHDLLLTPTTACTAFGADALAPKEIAGKDATLSGPHPCCYPANACWNPSISIPAGVTAGGMPVGLMITARRHRDDVLLRLARLYEQAFPWSYPWD